jgi:hypothetical protein
MPALTINESDLSRIYIAYLRLRNRPEISQPDLRELLDRAIALAFSDIEGSPVQADLLLINEPVDFVSLTDPWQSPNFCAPFSSEKLLSGGQYVPFADRPLLRLEKNELKAYLRSTGDGGSFLVLSIPQAGQFVAEGLLFLASPLFSWFSPDDDQLSKTLETCLHLSIRDRSVFVHLGKRRLFRISRGEIEEPPNYHDATQSIVRTSSAFFASVKEFGNHICKEHDNILAAVTEGLNDIVSAIASQRHGATLVFNVDFDLNDQKHFYPGAIRTKIDLGNLLLSTYYARWLGYGACQGNDDEYITDIQEKVRADQLAAAQRAIIGLSRNDGALVFDSHLSLVGAGAFLRADSASLGHGGARHKSAESFVLCNPHVLALVISQDGPATFFTKTPNEER